MLAFYVVMAAIWCLILYYLMKAAVNNSKVENILTELKEIKAMLKKANIEGNLKEGTAKAGQPDGEPPVGRLDVPYDKCPACGAELAETDTTCPSCGINLT